MTEKETRIEELAREILTEFGFDLERCEDDYKPYLVKLLTRFASEIEQAKVKDFSGYIDKIDTAFDDPQSYQHGFHDALQVLRDRFSLNKQEQPESGKEK